MITKLFIPVSDTSNVDLTTDIKISNDDYARMTVDRFNRNKNAVNELLFGDGTNLHKPNNSGLDEKYSTVEDVDVPIDVLLLDSDKDDLDERELFDRIDDERMFVLVVNVNPETLDGDAEYELQYWIDDCIGVWEDRTLDEKTKLLATPSRTLKVELSDGHKYTLENCKVFENYADNRFPIYFAMVVEKITK